MSINESLKKKLYACLETGVIMVMIKNMTSILAFH